MLTIIALVIAIFFLPAPWNVVLVAAAALVDLVETGVFVWWSRRRRRLGPAAVGVEAIVGRSGVALGRLEATSGSPGQVRVDGEIWAARAEQSIDPGANVVVSAVEGLVLVVEAASRG